MEAMKRLSRRWMVGFSQLALAGMFLLSPITKAYASVSWGQEITEVAKRYIGVKYQAGGVSPKGFDASGFTQYVFNHSAAKMTLPRTAKDQYKTGSAVKKSALQQGDLVFFNTNGKGVSFVGIYEGNDTFLAVTSKGVKYQSLNTKYWKDRYVGAKRVLKE
jgi:murein DD-endopeptidase